MCVTDCRIVAVLANMIVLSPCATQDLPIMARHHAAYDHVGLAELAEQTTTSTNLPDVDLACKYVQEAVEISSRSKVTFQWNARTLDHQTEERVCVRVDNAYTRGVPLPTSWRTANR